MSRCSLFRAARCSKPSGVVHSDWFVCGQVKTDLVLRGLRDAGGVLLGPSVLSYNALVDKYFPQPPTESESTPLELHRYALLQLFTPQYSSASS